YTFPEVEKLVDISIEELKSCGIGFRAKYAKDTISKIYTYKDKEGIFNLNWISSQNDDICYTELQKFKGIGPKIADCVMLFSMGKYSAFPVDVWVKRGMTHFYNLQDVSLKEI